MYCLVATFNIGYMRRANKVPFPPIFYCPEKIPCTKGLKGALFLLFEVVVVVVDRLLVTLGSPSVILSSPITIHTYIVDGLLDGERAGEGETEMGLHERRARSVG